MAKYFTGKSVASKTLVAADAITFADLVRRHIDLPVVLPLTREAYHKLPEAEQREVKKCAYIVACTFPSSPWEGRLLEHAGPCNLLFLDIDTLKKDGSSPAAPFVQNPKELQEKLRTFNYAVYHTISSTPEKPRLRIMVEADAIPPEKYPDAVLTLAQRIGLPLVTRESAVAVQPMFRPCVFSDQDTDFDHPMLVSGTTSGRAFTVDDISDDLDSLPGIVSGSKPLRAACGPDDFLFFYQMPVPQITLEVAKEAIGFVSPDISRPEWIEMAAALKHQFGENEEAGAFELFVEWSSKGDKFAGEKDCVTNWKSLHEQPVGRAPVTIRSLLKRALEAGWDGRKVKEECFQSVASWLQFDAKSATELMTQGVRRIASLPMSSHVEEEALMQILGKVLKQKFETSVSLSALRKDLRSARNSLVTVKDADETDAPGWARNFVYVVSVKKFYRHTTGQRYDAESFNAVFGRKLLPSADDLKKAEIPVSPATLNKPLFVPSDYMLHHLKCQTADDFTYAPGSPDDAIVQVDGLRMVNTYRPTFTRADGRGAWEAWEIVMEHIGNLIAEPDYQQTLMDWMAYIVQNPGAKIRWSVVLQGAEGCGKTLLAEILRACIGPSNTSIVDKESVMSAYNDWAADVQFVCIEEIRVAGSNRHDAMNKLKQIVTNTHLPIHERFRNDRVVRNLVNLMVLTNFHDALAVTGNNRRYYVLKSRLQTKEQVLGLRSADPNYFERIYGLIETNPAALRYLFETWQISSSFDPDGHAPDTTYLREMVDDTSSELDSALAVLLDSDIPTIQPDVIASTSLLNALKTEGGMTSHITPQYVAKVLRDKGMSRLPSRHRIGGGERQFVWYKPSLINGCDPLALLEQRVLQASKKEGGL